MFTTALAVVNMRIERSSLPGGDTNVVQPLPWLKSRLLRNVPNHVARRCLGCSARAAAARQRTQCRR
ncbi:unnamed protein product [Arctia plantaginis]|uniref:Uncharacterized protein n=1 Tax=Arctia plantaginis TaxID=874455 RepID=A0A8S0Z0D7_ARCPL|nr:unnamed protein product [Arctia plantaginis]